MALLINAPGFHQRALPLSVAAWHQMIASGLAPKRAELIRGVIVEKMSKSIAHSKLATRMAALLGKSLDNSFWIRREDPITTKDSEPEPDLSVVAGPEASHPTHPTTAKLVVEISVSTLVDDREMAAIYAEAGVEEYWIVNASGRCLEIYRQPTPSGYANISIADAGQVIRCLSLPAIEVNVDALFADLPGA